MILRYFQPFPTIDLLQFTLLLQSAPTLQLRRAPKFYGKRSNFPYTSPSLLSIENFGRLFPHREKPFLLW